MSTIYLLVDSATSVIQSASYTESAPGATQFGVTVDSTATNATACLGNPQAYLWQSGAIVPRPSFALAYDHTAGTLTATLNNAPSTLPTVAFTVGGQAITATPTTGTDSAGNTVITATADITVHPSLGAYSVVINVSANGFRGSQINVGASATTPPVAIQAYQASSTSPWTVAPVGAGSKQFLADYWTTSAVPAAYALADVATENSLLTDAVFNVLIPWAQKLASGALTLTTDQASTVSDWQTNVSPTLVTTLAEAVASKDIHYATYKTDRAATKQALVNYGNDLANIPGLQ